MQVRQAGIVAVAIGGVGAAPQATTLSAATNVGVSTMDVYPPAGSKFKSSFCLLVLLCLQSRC